MIRTLRPLLLLLAGLALGGVARADDFSSTVSLFKKAGESGR
jgi:hypothetical protein